MTGVINATYGRLHVRATVNPNAKDGVVKTANSLLSMSKYTADFLGAVAKSAELATPLVSDTVKIWTHHLKDSASKARNMLAIPYCFKTWEELWNKRDVRTLTEAMKITSFATAAVLPDAKMAGSVAKIGGGVDVALTVMDLTSELEMHNTCSNLANTPMGPEVRKVVDSQLWASACKIFKLALTLFTGVVATSAWIFGLAIPASLATAALVASLGAIALSFVIGYSEHKAEWKAKVTLASA
ncbi:MAG TPA: hypothetical protein VGO47_02260 [Chlamydiales bacterium]|jgi:hypothetical protein|nr:hypothetical protein [Chlamydiales bacterium]